MNHALPLLLAASALLAAVQDSSDRSVPQPATPQMPSDPPWLSEAWHEVAAGSEMTAGEIGLETSECPHASDHESVHDFGHEGAAHEHVHEGSRAAFANTPRVQPSAAGNGRTVEQVFSQRSPLAEQRVRVRGAVVKRTDGILGKTFLHLQDGTGSPEHDDFDLTVTTLEAFELGETVEVEGTLRLDRDLGMGYRYTALLEDATRIVPD